MRDRTVRREAELPRRVPALAARPPLPAVAARLRMGRLTALTPVVAVAAPVLLALYWAFLVPIYQGPDEIVLIDYAFTIHQAGHLVTVRDRPSKGGPVHPWTQYLATATGAEWIAFHPQLKASPGYGGSTYYAGLDAQAPPARLAAGRAPFLVDRYPFLYFALEALWLGPVTWIAGPGPVELFFGARLLNVLMLAVSLLAVYGVARELRWSRRRALILVVTTGLFPMVTFVSSYTQPDNLGFTLVSLALYCGLRLRAQVREAPGRLGLALAGGLGLALGGLVVTKYQFFLAAAIPILAMLATELMFSRARRDWLQLPAALLVVPAGILFGVQTWITWGSTEPLVYHTQVQPGWWTDVALRNAAHQGPGPLLDYLVGDLQAAVQNFWLGGQSFTGFWGRFGWEDTPLFGSHPTLGRIVLFAVQALTLAVLGLLLVRMEQALTVLVGMWRRGRRRWALKIAFGNPAVNAVLLFAVSMVGLYVYMHDSFFAQGRNWLPFVPWIFLITVAVAPRALTHRRSRALASQGLLALLVLYSVVGSWVAVGAVRDRFYGADLPAPAGGLATARPAVDGGALAYSIDWVNGSPSAPQLVRATVDSTRGPLTAISVSGWALDSAHHAPVGAVYLEIDGAGDYAARYGDAIPDAAPFAADRAYRHTGFDLVMSVAGLAPGTHELSIKILSADGRTVWSPPDVIAFRVAPAAP